MRRISGLIATGVISLVAGFCMFAASAEARTGTAIFAGGCFWCMDAEFAATPGVVKVISGYTGGHTVNPTYEDVSSGTTGHFESVQVWFDPDKVTYQKLLGVFWRNVDPTDEEGQFCDKGSQYRAGIFYLGDAQKKQAEESLEHVKTLFKGQEVATLIRPASVFYPAEAYHQDYHEKSALHYKLYRAGCGRDRRLDELWKKKPQPVTP